MIDLIGINGFKRSGKDTTFQLLSELLPDVERRAFADKLKMAAALALGYTGTDDELVKSMDALKEQGVVMSDCGNGSEGYLMLTGRQFLQNFGRYHREVFGDSFWVDQILPEAVPHTPGMTETDHTVGNQIRLKQRYPNVQTLCITDVRYPNEAERILSLGGDVLEIVRPGLESDGHESETPLPPELVSWTIHNDGDIDDLRRKLVAWL